jgi:hypothetical protein
MKKSLLCLLGGLLLPAAGCATQGDAASAAPLPEPGQTVTLADDDDSVCVYTDATSQDRGVQLAVAQDEEGLGQMIAAGTLYQVPRGTRARVIQLRFPGTAEVRFLDGTHQGESAWVAVEPLHAE